MGIIRRYVRSETVGAAGLGRGRGLTRGVSLGDLAVYDASGGRDGQDAGRGRFHRWAVRGPGQLDRPQRVHGALTFLGM